MIRSHFYQMLALASFFLLVVIYFLHPVPLQGTNVDLGHHLQMGKITIEKQYVPQTNLLSLTHADYQFVNNQWLSEVVFYPVYSYFGFDGLILLAVFLVIATYGILFFDALKKNALFPTLLIAFFSLQLFIDRTDLKPELFSFLLLSLFLYILYTYRETQTKLIFLLPLFMALWINFHIFFIVGFAVLFLFLFDFFMIQKEAFFRKKGIVLLGATFFTFLGSLVNPNGIKAVIYPFHVLNDYGYEVIENLTVFSAIAKSYADITFVYFFVYVFFLFLGMLFYYKRMQKIDILLILLFTFLAFFAVRNFPLFALGVFIPSIRLLSLFLKTLSHKYSEQTIWYSYACGVSLYILCITPGVYMTVNLHGLGFGVIDNAAPAITFFKNHNLKGPVFNNYNIGNYLEYALYPQEKVFVAGNPEQYPARFFSEIYYPMEKSYTAFKKLSKKYNIQVVFYEHKNQTQTVNPLLTELTKDKNWKIVFLDSQIIIFVQNTNNYQNIPRITEQKIVLRPEELTDKVKIGNLSNLFRILGWYNQMAKMDLLYLKFEPNNCTALRHVAVVMNQQNHPLKNTYLSRYQTTCSQQ